MTQAKAKPYYTPGHLPQHLQPWGLLLKLLPSPQMRLGLAWCLNHKPAKKKENELKKIKNYKSDSHSQHFVYIICLQPSGHKYHRDEFVIAWPIQRACFPSSSVFKLLT